MYTYDMYSNTLRVINICFWFTGVHGTYTLFCIMGKFINSYRITKSLYLSFVYLVFLFIFLVNL